MIRIFWRLARAVLHATMALLPSVGWIAYHEASLPIAVAQASDPLRAAASRPARRHPPPLAAALPDVAFAEADLALFDLQQPGSTARLRLAKGQRLRRQRRQLQLWLPADSLLVLPEVQCAPTYRAALRLQIDSALPGRLDVLVAPLPQEDDHPPRLDDCIALRQLSLGSGQTTTRLTLPDLERLTLPAPAGAIGAPAAAGLLVLRFVADPEHAMDTAGITLRTLELRGLSLAGA